MKKYLFLFVLILSLCFASCKKDMPSDSGIADNQDMQNTVISDENKETAPEEETKEIKIILYNADTEDLREVSYTYSGTVETLPTVLLERIRENPGYEFEYNSISVSGTFCNVDFAGGFAPSANVGSAQEKAILESVSETIFANFNDVQMIYCTVDTEPYSSGHILMEKDEPYKIRSFDVDSSDNSDEIVIGDVTTK